MLRHEAWWLRLTRFSNAIEPAFEKFRQYCCRSIYARWTAPSHKPLTGENYHEGLVARKWCRVLGQETCFFSCCMERSKAGLETMAAKGLTLETQSSFRSLKSRKYSFELPQISSNASPWNLAIIFSSIFSTLVIWQAWLKRSSGSYATVNFDRHLIAEKNQCAWGGDFSVMNWSLSCTLTKIYTCLQQLGASTNDLDRALKEFSAGTGKEAVIGKVHALGRLLFALYYD